MKKFLLISSFVCSTVFAQNVSVPVMGTAPEKDAVVVQTGKSSTEQSSKRTAPSKSITLPKINPDTPPTPSQYTKDLYSALKMGNYQIAEMLLQQGADINCRNCSSGFSSETALGRAAQQGSLPTLQWMLSHGADVNVRSYPEGKTPLMSAIMNGNSEIIGLVLQHGPNPKIVDAKGLNALMYLIIANSYIDEVKKVPLARILLSRGTDPNQSTLSGETALMHSAAWCQPNMVKLLLQHGANPAAKSIDGNTANNLAYKRAVSGDQTCNLVMSLLREGVPKLEPDDQQMNIPAAFPSQNNSNYSGQPQSVLFGEWRGVLNPSSQQSSKSDVELKISPNGQVSISSKNGLNGAGQVAIKGNSFNGNLIGSFRNNQNTGNPYAAEQPAQNLNLTLSGALANGVIKG
ncbi:MAG: serine/threonine-protein phosphatase 6 regulatory ankyrin repeat subunit isoform, partial [Pseudomonadota bacterium]